jgi:hypothetical protein
VTNNVKAQLAKIGVIFVIGGLAKVAQKTADDKIDARWPKELES